MTDNTLDVNSTESSDVQPTEASQAPQPSGEDVKTSDKNVPYDRFKEVNDQKNHYKELLDQATQNTEKTQIKEPAYSSNLDEVSQAKAWQDFTVRTAEVAVEKRLKMERVKAELDDVSKKEDFGLVAGTMNRILKENPGYSIRDAYDLAKLRDGIYETQLKDKFSKSQDEISKKAQKAQAETITSSSDEPVDIESIAWEKDEKGNFKYSPAELKRMLKKK